MDLAHIKELLGFDADTMGKFDTYRGGFISLWAGIESCMDRANHYAWLHSHKAVSEKVPVSLWRKIKLFKEVNRDLLPFEPLRAKAENLSARVDALYEDRHWLAHGYILPDKCSRDHWTLAKHEFPRDTGGLITVERAFTDEDMRELRAQAIELAFDFGVYTEALALQVEKHASDDGSC